MIVHLIIPAFNEKERLGVFLNSFAAAQPFEFKLEMFVGDDGSHVEQSESMQRAVQEAQAKAANIHGTNMTFSFVRFATNRGKGAVLRELFQRSLKNPSVDLIGFADSDGATPFFEVMNLITFLQRHPTEDAVIGCRLKCLGKDVRRSLKRHLSGRIFATLLSNLFSIPIYDSQCGAKIFRTQKLRDTEILSYCDDQRWLFDTQLVILTWLLGWKIVEKPVDWSDQAGSKVRLFSDSARMFMGLLRFRRKLQQEPFKDLKQRSP